MRRSALALAAALAGASGLALEVLLVDCAGLAIGYGSSAALGLATFIASWALGAHLAGRSRSAASTDLFRAGLLAGLVACPAVWGVLWAGGAASSGLVAAVTTVAAIACVGFLHGRFLAPLARAFQGEVSWLLAANFGGALAGAYGIGDFAVAAGGRLRFAPGGLHLMLFRPSAPLVVGQRLAIELTLDDGRTLDGEAVVRDARVAPATDPHAGHR